jgi:transglutaminase-like putative cysteine protease
MRLWRRRYLETRRLPWVSVALLILIVVLALPFFLIAPRTSSSALRRSGGGLSGFVGFSENVNLGEIGQLKRTDEIFMHVRIESGSAAPNASLRWRGVALDEFTGRAWKKSPEAARSEKRESESGLFQVGTTQDLQRLTIQTFFLEPVDTAVLFGAPRIVAVQGRLPFVRVDSEGAIQTRPHEQERVAYKALSDTTGPSPDALRADPLDYPVSSARYLELSGNLDPRIAALASKVTTAASARTGYDKARAIETYLRDSFGYTLEMRAGGQDPLADFLFNVRAGHCEYFATAMAVMLRTQGIASRVVNGFLPGEYNEAAGAFTVRQSDAHSWVEVYFPQTNSWVTFDPTPPAGRTTHMRTGLAGQLSKLSEALELMWFQYVVAYDKQEQHSLMTSLRRELFDLRRSSTDAFEQARKALPRAIRPALIALVSLGFLMLALLFARRVRQFGWRRGLKIWQLEAESGGSRIDFYDRLVAILEKQGIKRELYQTPLEFAHVSGTSEISTITDAYNRVRYGAHNLSSTEQAQIDELLVRLERRRTIS